MRRNQPAWDWMKSSCNALFWEEQQTFTAKLWFSLHARYWEAKTCYPTVVLTSQKAPINCSRSPLDDLTNAVYILTPFKRTSVLVQTEGEREGQEYLSPIVLQCSDDWCDEPDRWKQTSELWQLCSSSWAESLVSAWAAALLHLLCYTLRCNRRNWWQTAFNKVCQHCFRLFCHMCVMLCYLLTTVASILKSSCWPPSSVRHRWVVVEWECESKAHP